MESSVSVSESSSSTNSNSTNCATSSSSAEGTAITAVQTNDADNTTTSMCVDTDTSTPTATTSLVQQQSVISLTSREGGGTSTAAAVTTNGCATSSNVPPSKSCIEGSAAGSGGAVGEQFLQLAKSAKGAAAVQLIKEALEAPGLYVFAELLHMPNIKELSSMPEHSSYYRLLEVFAYGVYNEELHTSLPPLSPTMLTKLRHLTIVTMADSNKTLPLDTLVNKLGLNSRRELEDLIIEAIYADVLHGKLDQHNGVLEIEYAVGRDIKPEDLPNIAATLKAWCETCNGLLGTLEGLVISANTEKETSIRRTNNIEAEVNKIKSNFKRQTTGAVGGGSGVGMSSDSVDEGLSPADEKKVQNRLKKSAMPKSTGKFWPKS